MDYWTLKKKAIMGSMQSGRLTEAEGYPLKLENAIKGNMKDYKVWGNKKGKNLLKATDVYKGASNYQELVEDGRNCIRFVDNVTYKYYYSFKENTQYTVSFDCKTTIKSTANSDGGHAFKFYYTDGTSSNIFVNREMPWTHKTLTSTAGKTVACIGLTSYTWVNWNYIDIDTFQFEEGSTATEYEPYQENDGLGAFSGNLISSENETEYNYINADGTIITSPTYTQGYPYVKVYSIPVKPSTTYTVINYGVNMPYSYSLFDVADNPLGVVGTFPTSASGVARKITTNENTHILKIIASNKKVGVDCVLVEGEVLPPYFNYIDVVTSGKNMLKATDFYSKCGGEYSELVEDGRNCVRFVDSIGRKYQELTFKENTQYTVSFEYKTGERMTGGSTQGIRMFVIYYTDGTKSMLGVNYSSFNREWKKTKFTSIAGKTISHIGMNSIGYKTWIYIDIDTFQLEEGAEETAYEPYIEPITTTIDLTGHNSIMSNEYIDFKNGCIVRSDGTEEDIILPKIPLHKGYNILTASDAELEATKMYGKYLKKG